MTLAVGMQNVQGLEPRRSLEALMFTSEEPTRFGIGCIGRCILHAGAQSCLEI